MNLSFKSPLIYLIIVVLIYLFFYFFIFSLFEIQNGFYWNIHKFINLANTYICYLQTSVSDLWKELITTICWVKHLHIFFKYMGVFFEFYFTFFWILFIFLYSRFLLVIHFIHISVYMSIPISQFIPPPPPPPPPLSPLGVHTFVLYICVSISALQTGSSVPFL